MRAGVRRPLQLAVFAAVYFLGAMAYIALYWRAGDLPPVWPPAAIYLAALLLTPPARWPLWMAVALVPTLAAFLIGGYELPTILGIFVADSVAAICGAWLVQKVCGRPFRLDGLRSLAALILAGAIAAPVPSALIGAGVIYFGDGVPYLDTLVNWWSGDFTAIVLLTPLIVIWVGEGTVWPRAWRPATMTPLRLAELVSLVVAALAVPAAILLFLDWSLSFLVMPVLLWAAIRFGPREAALCNLLLAVVVIYMAMSGIGGGSDATALVGRLHYLQVFLAFMAIGASLTVAFAMNDWRGAERARARGEARWASMLDHAPMAIAVLDTDGRVMSANQRFAEWYRPGGGPVQGTGAADYYPPEVAAGIEAKLQQVVAARQPFVSEHDLALPDGGHRRLEVLRFPIIDEAGAVVAIGTIATDVTESRRASELLMQSQKMEAVGQLTGGVAHDFNNLLAVIIGNLELAQDHLTPGSETAQNVDSAFRAAERGETLTRSLLAFSRRQALRPEVLDLNAVLHGLQPLLNRTLGGGVAVEAVPAAGLWRCEVDRGQVENALLNLVINARDAMPDGGRLTVETANADLDDAYAGTLPEHVPPGQYAMIAVTDTGAGMTEEVRARVFEPFFTTKETGQGTGLGLSMVQGFVRQSGGHVSIQSAPGQGTTVKLYLPRSHAAVAQPSAAPVAQAGAPAAGSGDLEHVLVVEDEPAVRSLAVEILEGLGYRVRSAADGESARALVRADGSVDLLLTDVILDGGASGNAGGGPEVAAALQAELPGLKVLYMSGYTGNGVAQHGRLDPDVELLEKPFRRDDLARAVRRALDGGR